MQIHAIHNAVTWVLRLGGVLRVLRSDASRLTETCLEVMEAGLLGQPLVPAKSGPVFLAKSLEPLFLDSLRNHQQLTCF